MITAANLLSLLTVLLQDFGRVELVGGDQGYAANPSLPTFIEQFPPLIGRGSDEREINFYG